MDLHVNGTKIDEWHNLALQTPSDLDLKCRERLERICEFLEVRAAVVAPHVVRNRIAS